MAIPAKNILGNPNVTEGSFQIAIEQLRESVIGSGKVYDSANTYMANDTCEYSGVTYYSKINNNIGNTPLVGANWGDYADLILGVVHKTGNETIAGIKTFSDNVGIGVTPSAWYSTYRVNQLVNASISGRTDANQTNLSNNWYVDTSAVNRYISNGYATRYSQDNGTHYWQTAPTDTAGNPITLTTNMTLGSNGNLLVGTTTDNGVDKLQVDGQVSFETPAKHVVLVIYNTGDLNAFKTGGTFGTYPITNTPIYDHGCLEVIVYSPEWIMQRFTTLGIADTAGRVFVRCFTSGTTWTAWVEK